ncbi:MAG: hypothetical protein JO172_08390 [Hyphomicrobiales bacterium]|nr:hypothetical protein [Hyphomicrobiales bacterium]
MLSLLGEHDRFAVRGFLRARDEALKISMPDFHGRGEGGFLEKIMVG